MTNYEAVKQWTATLNADKAYDEMVKLKAKYPWLKCDESFKIISRMYVDLPKMGNIVLLQEKQAAIQREFVRVSRIADEAIVHAVAAKAGIEL
jgi:hypothetical protein